MLWFGSGYRTCCDKLKLHLLLHDALSDCLTQNLNNCIKEKCGNEIHDFHQSMKGSIWQKIRYLPFPLCICGPLSYVGTPSVK